MQFIKINDRYINLANVTGIGPSFERDGAVEVDYLDGDRQRLQGDDARALLAYLDTIAVDVAAPEHADADYQDFRRRGGALDYATWLRKSALLEQYASHSLEWFDVPRNQQEIARLEADLLI